MDLRKHRVEGIPVLAGAVNGALAYVAGFVGAFVVYLVFGNRALFDIAASSWNLPMTTGTGFAYYGGHFVPVTDGDGTTLNFALDAANNGALYVLLVVAVLVGTGWYLGSAEGLDSPLEGALAGGTQVFGYFPLAALGGVYFTFEQTVSGGFGGGTETVALELSLVRALLLAGLALPLVLGAIGGALAQQRS